MPQHTSPADPHSPLVVRVAVLTYQRPDDLLDGLPLMLEQADAITTLRGVPVTVDVLVVDNDAAGTGRRVVEAIARDRVATAASTHPDTAHPGTAALRYVIEPVPGIVAGRNRAIDEGAGANLLVFIDDDERPRDNWLVSLIDTWLDTRAAAVMGRVISEFDGELEPWVAAGEFFKRRSMPTGTEIQVAAAGNLLLDLDQVRALGVRFDDRIGMGSGEDSLFSRQLVQRGGRMVWCEESAATDRVPRARMSRRWVLDRARSHGNHETIVELYLTSGRMPRLGVRVRAIGRGLLRVAGGYVRYGLGVATGSLRHQARGLRTAYRGAGIATGGIGHAMQEYARPVDTAATA